jgi:PAS domain S-box-containing protein
MKDQDKTKEQLIVELEEVRRRLSALEASESEWRRMEDALQGSEERFRLLVEAIPLPIWRSDPDGNVTEFNRRWYDYTGQTAEEAEGGGWTKALHPDEAAMVVGEVRAGITTGAPIEIVNRLRRADGSYRWHLARAVPLSDRGGKTIGWFGCATDIDDQKKAEETLKTAHDELERRVQERMIELTQANEELAIFRKFAEGSGEGFGMSDFDGRIVYVNPTLCRLFGEKSPTDVIGSSVATYYPKEYLQRREDEMIPALMQTGYWHAEQTVLLSHRKEIPTLQSAFLIRDENGKPFRIAVVITDITERKQAEEALAASEEKYRQLVETTGTGYLILDGRGRVIDANAQYVRLSGHHTLTEILGRTVAEWTAPYDVERNAKEVEKCYQSGCVWQLEIDYVHPDGRIVPVEINATCLDTEDGRRIVALCRDVSERRQSQDALRQSHGELQTIYDGMQDGLLIADVETKQFVRCNIAMCRMLG